MKFSLDHPFKFDWKITDDAADVAIVSDLIMSCKIKGLANVTDLLQSQSVHGLVIINKNSQPATLFQHFPILTAVNCHENLLITVSQPWTEEAFFIPKSDIDQERWNRLKEIGKINLPIPPTVKYAPVRPQC